MYRLLAVPFQFPEPAATGQFIDGSWQQRIAHLAAPLGFATPTSGALTLTTDAQRYSAVFIALHEVGLGGAPCPLHSGHHAKDRMSAMEEVVRFYRFFDFRPAHTPDRFPDHLTFEFDFMAHLTDLEQSARDGGGDVASVLRAERDFLERNLAWLVNLVERVEREDTLPFCAEVIRLANGYVVFEREYLRERVRALDYGGNDNG